MRLASLREKSSSQVGIPLAFSNGVKSKLSINLLVICGLIAICCEAKGFQTPAVPPLSESDQRIADAFEKRVKAYARMREDLEGKMPKLSSEAKPEEIEHHKKQFQERVRAARTGSKRGEMFTPESQTLIRAIIKDEFKGRQRAEFRETVLREAENKSVAIRVNYPYPEQGELLEMPPTLLLRLPPLPKQVRYRFVRQNLLLVDRENGLIIDYMTNALP